MHRLGSLARQTWPRTSRPFQSRIGEFAKAHLAMTTGCNKPPPTMEKLLDYNHQVRAKAIRDELRSENWEQARRLITQIENINYCPGGGHPLLFDVIGTGDLCTARTCLQYRADPNQREDDSLFWNRTPLQKAASDGAFEMVQLLIEYGADINRSPQRNTDSSDVVYIPPTTLSYALPLPYEQIDDDDKRVQRDKLVTFLVREGVEVPSNDYGMGLYYQALKAGLYKSVQALNKRPKLKDPICESTDRDGNTLLLLSVKVGHKGLVEQYVKLGVPQDKENDCGVTACQLAKELGDEEIEALFE